MAQRSVCICDGEYIGIEKIFTVIDGKQINIPEVLKELRQKSQNNQLFCSCGCKSNLTIVAGDKNLREQHFRLKEGALNQDCHVISEGKISIDSKIVLKCWLDDKLKANDLDTRVPIHDVGLINRNYEFSFLSRERKVALSYCHERMNLSDEKIKILEESSLGIRIIYVVDNKNGGNEGQYPERLMKIQNKQGFCLLLEVFEADYNKAIMKAIFYSKNIEGIWQEVLLAEGHLFEFSIDDNGRVIFDNETLESKQKLLELSLYEDCEKEKVRRAEKEKKRIEKSKQLLEEENQIKLEKQKLQEKSKIEYQRQREKTVRINLESVEKNLIETGKQQEEAYKREEDFKRNRAGDFAQQVTQVLDEEGNRWIKCEFCEKIAKDDEFFKYGGHNHMNLGTCKECLASNPAVRLKTNEHGSKEKIENSQEICPNCGGVLGIKSGRYGKFKGCSNFPICRYIGKIRYI